MLSYCPSWEVYQTLTGAEKTNNPAHQEVARAMRTDEPRSKRVKASFTQNRPMPRLPNTAKKSSARGG